MSVILESLSAVTVIGIGDAIWTDTPKTDASLQVSYTGSPSDFEVVLECTIDGVHWVSLIGYNLGNGNGQIVGKNAQPPFVGLRAELQTLTGGTSPTVTAWIAAA